MKQQVLHMDVAGETKWLRPKPKAPQAY